MFSRIFAAISAPEEEECEAGSCPDSSSPTSPASPVTPAIPVSPVTPAIPSGAAGIELMPERPKARRRSSPSSPFLVKCDDRQKSGFLGRAGPENLEVPAVRRTK